MCVCAHSNENKVETTGLGRGGGYKTATGYNPYAASHDGVVMMINGVGGLSYNPTAPVFPVRYC